MTEYVITAPGMDKDEIKQAVFDMNLDLNFVNNHNVRKGKLNVACSAFREVAERHPGQPFAQYFLGKCLQKMGAGEAQVEAHYRNYRTIISSSKTWYGAAKKYGLEMRPEYRPYQAKLRA